MLAKRISEISELNSIQLPCSLCFLLCKCYGSFFLLTFLKHQVHLFGQEPRIKGRGSAIRLQIAALAFTSSLSYITCSLSGPFSCPTRQILTVCSRSFRFYPRTRHPLLLFKDTEGPNAPATISLSFLQLERTMYQRAVNLPSAAIPWNTLRHGWKRGVYMSHQAPVSVREHTWRFPHAHVLISGLQYHSLLPASALLRRHGRCNPYRPCQPNANNATFWSVMLPVVAAAPPFSWPIIWSFLP